MTVRRKAYVPTPKVPSLTRVRYEAVLSVLSGRTTVSEAARSLGLSRNHFQSVMHRGLSGLIVALGPLQPGRPARSPEAIASRRQLERLQKENRQLRGRVETTERLLGVASGLLKGKVKPMTRSRPRRMASTKTEETSDDEELGRRLDEADAMRRRGLPARLIASATGASESTLRRWRRRRIHSLALRRRRGPQPSVGAAQGVRAAVETLVRETRGLCGAASLARSLPGISRRSAASIKTATLSAMERERRLQSTRIVLTRPGILRGFDQLHVLTTRGPRYALVSGDGHVAYRTSLLLTQRYDEQSVLRAVTDDFALNGIPLVWRADRAKCQGTPTICSLMKRLGVLILHGPPRLPRYYGQLERQNREHRAFLEGCGPMTPNELVERCHEMLFALNTLWRRPTLGWKTSAEVWQQRPPLNVDRHELLRDVTRRAAHLERQLDPRARLAGLHERLAIEQALTERGLLCRIQGGWC